MRIAEASWGSSTKVRRCTTCGLISWSPIRGNGVASGVKNLPIRLVVSIWSRTRWCDGIRCIGRPSSSNANRKAIRWRRAISLMSGPRGTCHINVHGKSHFNMEEVRGRKGLRPLRQPRWASSRKKLLRLSRKACTKSSTIRDGRRSRRSRVSPTSIHTAPSWAEPVGTSP